ncbi:hypothetical protein FGIG_08049 [Fasciola gigantica]|uniref:Uncharacterized protein n=1 Tax=Fasciola gigantica TaxID=46835 RepID=A0A504YDW1_FASGI|nr:hypothetical protein FGIG_08049 [Fasciola gigantica]
MHPNLFTDIQTDLRENKSVCPLVTPIRRERYKLQLFICSNYHWVIEFSDIMFPICYCDLRKNVSKKTIDQRSRWPKA